MMRHVFAILLFFAALPSQGSAQLRISTDKDTVNFTKVKVGFYREASVRATNITLATVFINHMSIVNLNANPGEFQILVPQPTDFHIDSGEGRTIILRFTPNAMGIRTAVLVISTDDGDKQIQLIGEGSRIQPDILMQPLSVDFGLHTPGEFKDTTILLIGGDKDSARVDWISVVNDNGEVDFDVTPIDPNIVFPLIVRQGDTIKLNARFIAMNSSGPRTGRTIMEGEVSGGVVCEFRGAVGAADMTLTPQLLDLGIVPQGTSVDTFISVVSTGEASVNLQRIDAPFAPYSISGLPSFPYAIAAGDSLKIPVHFDAIAPGDFEEGMLAYSKNGSGTPLNRSALLKAFVIPRVLAKRSPQPLVVSCAIDSVYQRTLQISDTGSFPITINSISCSDTNFIATYPVTFPDTLTGGTTRNILITFNARSASLSGDTVCLVNILSGNRVIMTDTIPISTTPENASFGLKILASTNSAPNSGSIGIVSLSDITAYKLSALDLEFTIEPPDVAEIDTLNVTIDNSIYPNAVVKAGFDAASKKYFALVTSSTALPSSPIIPFLKVPMKYYVAKDTSAVVSVAMISPEKQGCLEFADQMMTISSVAGCGNQEIRNSLGQMPLLSEVRISPNPAHGNHASVSFVNAEDISLSSELLDVNGKLVAPRNAISLIRGRNALTLDVPEIASGTYTVHLIVRAADGNVQDLTRLVIFSK